MYKKFLNSSRLQRQQRARKRALTVSNTVQTPGRAGLTNVTYPVQGAINLMSMWSTLGKIASTQTHFSLTNWNLGPQQFCRLLVP